MPKLTLDGINKQLKASLCRLKVEQVGKKLYLRGTLPPKPPSQEKKWKQQRVSLGVNASQEGLKKAKTLALLMGASLENNSFSWDDYIETGQASQTGLTVGEAIERFEEIHFQTHPRNPTTLNNFKTYYLYHLKRLPNDKPLTKRLLIQTILDETQPDSYLRKDCYSVFQTFCRKILGEELGSRELKGKYETNAVDPEDLPSDSYIEETHQFFVRNPNMEACYVLMAIYGLRPSECFWVDQDSLHDEKGVIRVLTHKTKGKPYWRWVYPSSLHWLSLWNVSSITVPISQAETNKGRGATVSKFFSRHPKVTFNAYMLRHAYAARLARKNVDSAIAAKWMGHSNDIHCRIYHKFLDREHFDSVFDKYVID